MKAKFLPNGEKDLEIKNPKNPRKYFQLVFYNQGISLKKRVKYPKCWDEITYLRYRIELDTFLVNFYRGLL